jgi:glycosyltransferase involved in cell wall biosynthesis
MKKVAVVIPVYNEEAVISDCLKSLEKQTYEDFEVIIVDDGSIDKTLDTLSELQTTNYKLQILKQKHKGPGAARNLGAKETKGEILVFVDADMTFDKDFVKKLTEPIRKGKVIGTFSKEEYLANKNKVWARCWNLNRGLPPNRMHPEKFPDTQKVFRAITKKAFKKAGGFDEKAGYTDDWSLSERLGVEAVVAPGAIFYHKNPETLNDVFIQSRWMAKRRYKFGFVGSVVGLVRVSLPFSVIIGVVKAILHAEPGFGLFKIVSDVGSFLGILEFLVLGKVTK